VVNQPPVQGTIKKVSPTIKQTPTSNAKVSQFAKKPIQLACGPCMPVIKEAGKFVVYWAVEKVLDIIYVNEDYGTYDIKGFSADSLGQSWETYSNICRTEFPNAQVIWHKIEGAGSVKSCCQNSLRVI
jgi:hypothetical protein